jgi:polysaccharide export outer membrane protein
VTRSKYFLGLFLLLRSGLLAQTPAPRESLPIGAGDSIAVHVLEAPELDQHGRITDDGRFPLILGGEVILAGLTPNQAAQSIEAVLVKGHYVLNPHVSVVVDQSGAMSVTVLGQVKNPGAYNITTTRTVLDILAIAGGLTELADRKVIIERRQTKEQIPFVVSNRAIALLQDVPLVYPGDSVIVSKAFVVYVLGDVAKPGGYPASTNDSNFTVLQAIAFAGGTPPTAVPAKARLVRKKEDGTYVEMPLQISKMQNGQLVDFKLQSDDIIFVPYSYLKNVAVNLGQIVAASASAAIYIH